MMAIKEGPFIRIREKLTEETTEFRTIHINVHENFSEQNKSCNSGQIKDENYYDKHERISNRYLLNDTVAVDVVNGGGYKDFVFGFNEWERIGGMPYLYWAFPGNDLSGVYPDFITDEWVVTDDIIIQDRHSTKIAGPDCLVNVESSRPEEVSGFLHAAYTSALENETSFNLSIEGAFNVIGTEFIDSYDGKRKRVDAYLWKGTEFEDADASAEAEISNLVVVVSD